MAAAQLAVGHNREVKKRVFRPGFGRWFGYAWLVFAALNLVDLAVRGDDRTALVIATVLLLATAIVYVTTLRPRITADDSGVRIVNPLRDVAVPWGAVTEVEALDTVRVYTGEGRYFRCWAVQVANRQRRRAHSRRLGGRAGAGSAGSSSSAGMGRTSSGPSPEIADRAARRTRAEYVASVLDETAQRARRDAAPGRTATVSWSWLSLALLGSGVAVVLAAALIP